jgi:hypothetical protein
MRSAYRVLAWLVALGVVVQVAAVGFAHFGQDKWIDGGATLDKAVVESQMAGESAFQGVLGFAVHGVNGTMVIPALALLLLVVSFFADVPRGVLWAGVVVLLVVLQVALGFLGFVVPELGALHGINALALLGVAVVAARRVPAPATVATSGTFVR